MVAGWQTHDHERRPVLFGTKLIQAEIRWALRSDGGRGY